MVAGTFRPRAKSQWDVLPLPSASGSDQLRNHGSPHLLSGGQDAPGCGGGGGGIPKSSSGMSSELHPSSVGQRQSVDGVELVHELRRTFSGPRTAFTNLKRLRVQGWLRPT